MEGEILNSRFPACRPERLTNIRVRPASVRICEHVVESCFIAEKVRENVLCYVAQRNRSRLPILALGNQHVIWSHLNLHVLSFAPQLQGERLRTEVDVGPFDCHEFAKSGSKVNTQSDDRSKMGTRTNESQIE